MAEFKGVYVPFEVWYDERLSLKEKLYKGLYLDYGESSADRLIGIKGKSLAKIKNNLRDAGLLTPLMENHDQAKVFTIENSHKGQICQWCGKESYVLEQHHYPIPASEGGKEVVYICPNRHRTYHKIKEVR